MTIPTLDRIRQKKKNVLVLSNGHGEDLIALRVLEALNRESPKLNFEVISLVGEGRVFSSAIEERWLRKVGHTLRLPSGGFSNQSLKGFLADLLAGFLVINWKNWLYVRKAVKNGCFVIAVGDLLPLFYAWSSGGDYAFIGTPKSDYTWIAPTRSPSLSYYYHRLKGTEWEPWEWALMKTPRCKLVAVRDKLSARGLQKKNIRAHAPGNPMMDGLESVSSPLYLKEFRRLLLLCGSRMPEAIVNFKRLIIAAEKIESERPLAILVAIGTEPSLKNIESCLLHLGYSHLPSFKNEVSANACFEKDSLKIFIGFGKFEQWASLVEVGIANAGTATEQLVGLGVPCVSLPGKGPQFKYQFAHRQSRLLGGSVIPCNTAKKMAQTVELLLKDVPLRNSLACIGKKRMGHSGGSQALAKMILNVFLHNS
ncbi:MULTISPECIES: lipid-A-disaccharide synthase-related protein [unclassified Prochlorococcus]|uniref:lipid-A-disaccharide synthase-related protein n=1 Tax=unclassified Prochlorococcus TaxID=2627481 RepID=UPI0005338EDA|nr:MULTISPECIES: lipid-A-disaccharide synthase-related protein [unclassified Prochlorococcus]KGG14647.1 Lipid A disaccharide synthetase related enzyme [Prochlorococcus sp. MIT 0602]KGG15923.1 Lipid A disaccharide synthetase related enzyme [Prochlorococcus sp. MIT 0603]